MQEPCCGEGYYSQGPNTYKVDMALHKETRNKAVQRMRSKLGDTAGHVAFFQGGNTPMKYDTDTEFIFIQESFFQYLFGVKEPGFCGALDFSTGKSYLFIPKLPEQYSVWMGKIMPPEHYQKLYLVDEVHFIEEIADTLENLNAKEVHILSGTNTDSGNNFQEATFEKIEKFTVNKSLLHHELVESRITKTEKEVELLRYVNKVASEAHKYVMKLVKPGMMEYQAEAAFQHHCYFHGGCRNCAYTCICGSGENGAILHYGHSASPNNKLIKEGDMLLFDMGTTYHGYVSDITCSFPVGGKFTEAQKNIYNVVLRANREVMKMMKPGVLYSDCHLHALSVICEGLKELGLLQGELSEMNEHFVGALFMPHGLGHLMGIDTHDVGGYNDGSERIMKPSLKSLRIGRKLEAGMCITVEPGIYFIESLLLPAFDNEIHKKYLVKEKILPFIGTGGIRLEDDVVVTQDGIELLTDVPRTVEEIEKFFSN